MAKFVMKDAVITVNSVNLSDHCSSATVEVTKDEVDVTAFTSAAYRDFLDGFADATISCTFFQDFAAGSVDLTLWPLFSGSSIFSVKVKASSATTSNNNPEYQLTSAKMYGYTPIGGGVGDASSTDVTFRNSGTAGLVRGTT